MTNELMDWEECKKNFIKNVEIDTERANSIIDKALLRSDLVKKFEISEKTVSFIVEGYYEVIKELLIAYSLLNGFRSKNHQCLISYFYKENHEFENEAFLISQMSFLRNRLDYYGESVPYSFYEKNKEEFSKITKLLLDLIKKTKTKNKKVKIK